MTIFADSMPLVRFVVFVRSFSDQASPTKHQQFLRCLDILSHHVLQSQHVQMIQIEIYPGSFSVFLHRATSSRWSDLCGTIEKKCTQVLAQELQHRSRTLMQSHSQILKKIAPREPRFYFFVTPPLRENYSILSLFSCNVVECIDVQIITHNHIQKLLRRESGGIYPTSVFIY